MYNSPIDMITETFTEKIAKRAGEEVDNAIYLAVKHLVNVNKDELIKALKYDRNQYNIGYQDGYSEGYDKGLHDEREALLNTLKGFLDAYSKDNDEEKEDE